MTKTTLAAFIFIFTCVLFGAAPLAQANVSDFQLFTESVAVQYLNGQEQQRRQSSKSFPGNETSAPIETLIDDFESVDSSGNVLWQGFNRVVANDPQFNSALPTDFVLELAGGSADADISVDLTARTRQRRTVNVLADEFPLFNQGDELTLRSTFLLDGSLAAVIPATAGSAEGLKMKLSLDLQKDQSSLWAGAVTFTGQADGGVSVGSDGFADNDFLVTELDVPGIGRVVMVTFADNLLPYEYSARVGDTFELAALLSLEFSIPGGLAAGAAFGTVPAELIMMSEDLFMTDPAALSAAAAPEPGSMLLLTIGAFAALGRIRRAGR